MAEGLSVLRAGQRRGEPETHFLEGLWSIEGRFLPRNFQKARQAIGRAAELGFVPAARIFAGMLACGFGGAPQWDQAMRVLEQWSDRDPAAARQIELIGCMAIDNDGLPCREFARRELATDPRVELVESLLTDEECAFLIELSDPRMKPATIFHEAEQRFVRDPVRRSDKADFPIISEWPFVRAINLRIAAATATDVACGEFLQVLRYGHAQEYRPHFDAIAGMKNPRVLTALVWLNDDYSGGETSFDQLGLSVRGARGDLLLFANTLHDGTPDMRTRHAGNPVVSGVKYMASRWIRARPAGPEDLGRHEAQRA